MHKSDTIHCLMDNTAAGHCSDMLYSKEGDDTMPNRRVVPRTLIDRDGELEVRCLQFAPESGLRTFKVSRIVQVTRSVHLLSERERKSNTFATGEIKVAKPSGGMSIVFSLEKQDAETPNIPRRPVWMETWFREYAATVRECLSDVSLSDDELMAVRRFQTKCALSTDQVSAVHAYILGEELIGLAADGRLTADELQYVATLRDYLNHLGGHLLE